MLLAVTVIEFDKSCPCALYQLIRTQFYLPLSQNELVLRSPWLPSLFCFSVCLSTLTNYGTPLHLAQSWHEQPLCKVTTVALSPKGFLILGYPLLSHTHTHTLFGVSLHFRFFISVWVFHFFFSPHVCFNHFLCVWQCVTVCWQHESGMSDCLCITLCMCMHLCVPMLGGWMCDAKNSSVGHSDREIQCAAGSWLIGLDMSLDG